MIKTVELRGRALYNLLRIHWLEDPQLQVKNWQVEDYEALSLEQLFDRLVRLKFAFGKEHFLAYAEECSSPEELLDLLWVDEEGGDARDQLYLILFELWRRLLPEKKSLSIFCDALDWLMELYEVGGLEDEEPLQKGIEDLEDILDEALDREPGLSPQEIFQAVAQYFAHDLQGFLYDYIAEQVEEDREIYASELIEAFYDYIPEKKWFDLLRAWLFAKMDIEALNQVVIQLLEEFTEASDVELLLEMAKFLVHRGDVRLFMQVVARALPLLQVEEQAQRLLFLMAEYYRCLDRDREAERLRSMLHERRSIDPEHLLDAAGRERLIQEMSSQSIQDEV